MGNRLKDLRREKHLTQEKLAEISGVSRIAISMIENEKIKNVSSKTLFKLANALETTADYFFTIDA